MFWGIIYFISGMFMFVIPIVGWILGPLFMIAGVVKFIVGIVNIATPDKGDEGDVYYVNETAKTSVTEQLQQLSDVYEKGHMSEEEFAQSKAKLLKQL